jgi:hypothetical protein
MKRKFKLKSPKDIRFMLIEQYQTSTANILIRTIIDTCPDESQIQRALKALGEKHPYIMTKFYEEQGDYGSEFYYEYQENKDISYTSEEIADNEIAGKMDQLSEMRNHLFNHASGEICMVKIYKGENSSMVEFSGSHIIGEVPSFIILMGDFLKFLDQSYKATDIIVKPCQKFIFKEELFGLEKEKIELCDIPVPEKSEQNFDKWFLPEAELRRMAIPIKRFREIKNWLEDNNIEAAVSDVFYYIASQVLQKFLNREPDFWLALSVRRLLKNISLHSSVYNFDFWVPVSSNQFDATNAAKWIEEFSLYKKNFTTTPYSIVKRRNFCRSRSLNRAMAGTSTYHGRMIMNSIVKFPDFIFNNYGVIDEYIGKFEHFSIKDIEVQDGVPIQEIRFFTLNEVLYFNTTIFKNYKIDIDKFLSEFNNNLKALTNVALF